jgi:hypothetical protein
MFFPHERDAPGCRGPQENIVSDFGFILPFFPFFLANVGDFFSGRLFSQKSPTSNKKRNKDVVNTGST